MGGVWIFTLFLVVAAVSFGYVVAGTASSVNAPNPAPVICPATAD